MARDNLNVLFDEEEPTILPCRPTTARPGTEAKVAVITDRYWNGQALWHPEDATREDMVAGSEEAFEEPDDEADEAWE